MELVTQILSEFWGILSEMAPYLLFGFFVAGLLSIFISQQMVERNLGTRGIWPVVKASLFGVPLPLCSCGVIPVGASLRKSGASRSATTSFLLSTPQTGIDSIMVTYSLLGPVFAIFRPVAAFVTGVLGGTLVELFHRNAASPEAAGQKHRAVQQPKSGVGARFIESLKYGFVALPQDIAKPLIVGLIIAAVMALALPDDFFAGLLGTGIWPMLAMMLAGIPIYVCATASVPIAAAFIAKGISPGAALVFLMTGPATNAATITTIWKILGRKTALIYLFTVAASALIAGFILDSIFYIEGIPSVSHLHSLIPGIVEQLSAIALLHVLGYALWKSYSPKKRVSLEETDMDKVELKIKGMTCNHCVANVKRALEETDGVQAADVDLKRGKAVVSGEGCDLNVMKAAVEKIGYTVVD